MMTSAQIRQSFLDFFKSKQHTIVPSSSLLPDSPNLLFTNAGMNQFVPIFLGQTKCPYTPGRAADTQKCIRAGGKHNDLDDVGLDTYHHTFFEMLGNWSFGDYFKKEAIDWAWELVVGIWKFPPQRLYATVYSPDKSQNDPSEFDQEAWNFWAEKFRSVGLDPKIHIVSGNKKDNFWMMGDTGPCGPCSELHVDLTQNGDTNGALVNKGSSECIEIWNLVFIQFNANPDGTFSPLPAKHVDTGMGFERVTSILQCTKGFTNFGTTISNYETDIFRPIFDELEKLSSVKYKSTLPQFSASESQSSASKMQLQPSESQSKGRESQLRPSDLELRGQKSQLQASVSQSKGQELQLEAHDSRQIAVDIAFRVIADHIRTLSFAIADGIQPGNTDRNYVLRRILRRAVRYGRTLGFHEPFFYKLVDVLADTMGDVFPEIRARKKQVQETIRTEEEAFNKTLDSGLIKFEELVNFEGKTERGFLNRYRLLKTMFQNLRKERAAQVREEFSPKIPDYDPDESNRKQIQIIREMWAKAELLLDVSVGDDIKGRVQQLVSILRSFVDSQEVGEAVSLSFVEVFEALDKLLEPVHVVSARAAFILYDTYGFPLDLTELMARERGLTVDKDGFEKLMEEQRARARAAQKKEVISLSQIETTAPTKFTGFEKLESHARVLEVVSVKDKTAVVLDTSPFYAEMGGQVGDTGEISGSGQLWRVVNTQKSGNTFLHFVEGGDAPAIGAGVTVSVEKIRRDAIQRHHTVTHLLHWALHEVVSKDATQKGSFVGPDKLTFDFNSAPLTPQQIADVERLVNEKILENEIVSWTEVPHADVKHRKDVMQFFGDKYGDVVRVVQIGGDAKKLNGYSMELCGGTHVRATGEIGLFRIVGESAIAAGVRRIEAVAGLEAYRRANDELHLIKSLAGRLNSPVHELEKKVESLLAHQKELEREIKIAMQRNASNAASELLGQAQTVNGIPLITHNLGNAEAGFLQAIADSLKGRFKGVVVLGGGSENAVTLIATVSSDFTSQVQAGKIIQAIAPIVGGKGGGKPDNARGGGKDVSRLDEALAKAKSLIQN